jgi:MEDS: MEthanogen/methylotroph, DcmR Sensory domain
MASWAELLSGAEPGEHVVQLYGDDDGLLNRNVGRYLAEGLRREDGIVVIATPEHIHAIAKHLVEEGSKGAFDAARAAGRLVMLDAECTLARLLLDGRPDAIRFRSVVGGVIGGVRARSATGSVRAFGEMVSLLWDAGRRDDAARLEGLWNGFLAESCCSLFCAYRIDLFHLAGDGAALHPIVASHDHVFAGSSTLLSGGRAHA